MIRPLYIYLLFFILSIQCFASIPVRNTDSIKLITTDTAFVSGILKTFHFTTNTTLKPLLYCSNSYGTTITEPSKIDKHLFYNVPKNIANKRGLVTWSLVVASKTLLTGNFKIIADTNVSKIETYIGPPTIQAGGRDFSMSVIVPTDSLDNPVMDDSKVQFKKQFLNYKDSIELTVSNLMTYAKIYSTTKTGRFLIASECFQTNSKEHTLDVLPSLPVSFNIYEKRNHSFADGNQITLLSTSIIKDAYKNIVSDGTYVSFITENKYGSILVSPGLTISGIATAKLLHPDHEEKWKIKAYISGMAESNMLLLNYLQVVKNYAVAFSNNNQTITIGPFKSFMQQLIPDGLQVKLTIYSDGKLYKTYSDTSKKGFVIFNLDPALFTNKILTIKTTSAEISKTFENIKIW